MLTYHKAVDKYGLSVLKISRIVYFLYLVPKLSLVKRYIVHVKKSIFFCVNDTSLFVGDKLSNHRTGGQSPIKTSVKVISPDRYNCVLVKFLSYSLELKKTINYIITFSYDHPTTYLYNSIYT
jgi:hypothetical protein